MSSRKYYRQMVRAQATAHGAKPSSAVHNWRRILGLYPKFTGKKRQKLGSRQPICVYPVPRNSVLLKSAGLFNDDDKKKEGAT